MDPKEKLFSKVLLALILLIMAVGSWFVNRSHDGIELVIGSFAGSYWDTPNGDSYQILDEVIRQFEEAHPNVHVRYVSGIRADDYSEWLAEQILRGREPDLFFVLPEDFSVLASSGILADLDKLVANDRDFDPNAYYEPCMEAGVLNGQQYALPYESVPTIMFVNKTLLAKNDIAFPRSSWTWEDFHEICRKVTSVQDQQYGVYNYSWLDAAYANGASLFAKDGSASLLSDEKILDAIQFVMQVDSLNMGFSVTARDFDLGHVAFRPFLYSEYRAYQPYPWRVKKYTNFDWEGITMPAGPEGGNISQLNTMLLGMSSRTRHQSLAWEFAKLLSYNEETQKNLCRLSSGISPLIAVAEDPAVVALMQENIPGGSSFDQKLIHQIMSTAAARPNFSGYDEALSKADSAVREGMKTDQMTAASLAAIEREINRLLSRRR